jgi:hypothetical protein
VSYFSVVTQGLAVSTNNTSVSNLNAGNGYTFTGSPDATLGYVGVRVNLFADQDCTVSVQQSTTSGSPNWDVVDTYQYLANSSFAIMTQVATTFYRVVVSTVGSATTTVFRLQSVLTPISEPLPRSLNNVGHLRVAVGSLQDDYGFRGAISPSGELRTCPVVRVSGSAFDLDGNGGAVDSNFWIADGAHSGAVTQSNGQAVLSTGASANGYATMYSVRRARYVAGTSNVYRAVIASSTALVSNFTARWGVGYAASMPAISDGAWFQMNGSSFSLVTQRAGVEAVVTSFNGTLGAAYVPDLTSHHEYEIYYGDGSVYFCVDRKLLHTVAVTGSVFATMALYIFTDVTNGGTPAVANSIAISELAINRLGQSTTASHYGRVTTAGTYNLKYGAGALSTIVLNKPTGTLITVYDGLGVTSNVLAIISPTTSAAPVSLQYGPLGIPFSNGLAIVSTGTWDATVIYE